MANIEGLSPEEIKELIIEQLKEMSVDTEAVEVKVSEGLKITLKGKVDSHGEHYLVKETIMNIVGIEDFVDELVVIEGLDSGLEEEKEGLYDEDDDKIGTEDAFEALEDGIPYIPPTEPKFRETEEPRKKKRKKKD